VVNVVGSMGRAMWDYRIITVLSVMLWIFRFFKSFMAQPRLAMITMYVFCVGVRVHALRVCVAVRCFIATILSLRFRRRDCFC
jgi:hypothetical protein